MTGALIAIDVLLVICLVMVVVWVTSVQRESQRDFREVQRRLQALETTKTPPAADRSQGEGREVER